ncbi:MAG: orotate phosphoribosyltransferase [Myxococcota bacterium]|nr:orotate phosphoribosyltransferase [Myxococcota bacterium]MDW8361688.1 orotate phosphoribosyltransferase [Myxococcales bacterium]
MMHAVAMTEAERLLELLRSDALRRGWFTLASGRSSDWLIDCKRVVLRAEGHALVAAVVLDAIGRLEGPPPVAVAGVELGGCPLASAVALRSHQLGRPLDAIYVRKSPKDHGSRGALEGAESLPPGARVVVVEDVVTTGGSTLAAVEKLRAAGFDVVGVVALVDRGEGAAEALAAASVPLLAVFHRGDLLRS